MMKLAFFGYLDEDGVTNPVREKKINLLFKANVFFKKLGLDLILVDYSSINSITSRKIKYLNFNNIKSKTRISYRYRLWVLMYLLIMRRQNISLPISMIISQKSLRGYSYKQILNHLCTIIALYTTLIKQYKINAVIVWNAETPYHLLFRQICYLNKIKFLGIEGGMVPGTVEIDFYGTNANGSIQQNRHSFNKLSICRQDVELAKKYLSFIKHNKFSKKHQPVSSESKKIIKNKNKSIILLAGIDEKGTNLLWSSKKKHCAFSPFYTTEKELLNDLIKIAEVDNYQIIYKVHPNSALCSSQSMKSEQNLFYDYSNVDIFDLINVSDVMITIGSTVSIHSIIFGKPVVLVGVNSLYGFNICYDLKNQEDLRRTIKKALSKIGFTNMQKRLIEYVARSTRYYSIPFSKYCEEYYDNGGEKLANKINQMINGGHEFIEF